MKAGRGQIVRISIDGEILNTANEATGRRFEQPIATETHIFQVHVGTTQLQGSVHIHVLIITFRRFQEQTLFRVTVVYD